MRGVHGIWWEFTVYDGSSESRHCDVAVDVAVLWIDWIVYTRIYLHLINIYLHKRLNTTVSLVYTVIYSCIRLYTIYLALSPMYTWYICVYTKYIPGLFPMPCHMEGPFPLSHDLSYGICSLSNLCHTRLLLQLISSPYSPHDWIIEYMELTSQDFMLSGFL